VPSTRPGLLECIERYFAVAPLPDARMAPAGALDVPIGGPAWPYPARPRPGAGRVSVDDVRAAVALEEAAGLPVSLEWTVDRHPELLGVAAEAGLAVRELPLLVAADPVEVLLPAGFRLYVVGADDPELPRYLGVADAAVGESSVAAARTAILRERIATGRTVMMVALHGGEPVAVGLHQPVAVEDREVSELVGMSTLPRLRGHGLGAALASALVAHARETAEVVFLSAGDDDVAHVYERVGFARLGSTGVAR
jgi:GNAT superfamily N-acetyltransferase